MAQAFRVYRVIYGKKTAKIIKGLLNFDKIRTITCDVYIKTISIRRTNKVVFPTPANIFDFIKGSTMTFKLNFYNKKPVFL